MLKQSSARFFRLLADMVVRIVLGLLLGIVATIVGCNGGEDEPYIDNVPVRVEIILTNIEAQPLKVYPNILILNNVGVKGIVLHQSAPNVFVAYDRACSFRPSQACERLSLHNSGLYLVDSCCRSQFNHDGSIRIGPAYRPLRYYTTTFLAANRLLIVN